MSQDPTAAAPEPVDPTPDADPTLPGEPSEVAAEITADLADDPVGELDDTFVVPAGTVIVTAPSLAARLGAELFGTFFLVLAGLGVALYAATNFASIGGGGGALAVALAFGLAVAAGVAAVGHVSGGHFNPAVTFGAALGGRTPWRDVLPYWLAQLVGGALGAAVVFVAIPKALPAAMTQDGTGTTRSFYSALANGFGEHSPFGSATSGQVEFSLFAALVVEIVVTAVFVGVILGVTDRRTKSTVAPFAIGLTLAVLILVAMPVTNASLNPARSLAAAIFSESWAWSQIWVFWVGPLVGAALAGIVYRAFAAERPELDNLLEEDDVDITDEDLVVEQR